MKLFQKQKRKEGVRRVFGFLCSPQLTDNVKAISKELSLPIFAAAEHGLATGVSQMLADMKDEATKKSLQDHLIEGHFLAPLFKAGNIYDQEASIKIRRWQLRRWELDRIVHRLVSIVEREGIPPSLLIEATRNLIRDARSRRDPYNRHHGGSSYE